MLKVASSYAQTNTIQFTQVEGTNGITLGKINAIVQDELGFIWLSDQSNRCIIRYDGNHMTRFAYNPQAEFSLGGYYPEALYADTDGVIWIGYYGQGLDRFDTKTQEIVHWQHDPENPESLPSDFVTAVLRDQEGKIWIGHYNGISQLDETSGIFTTYSHDPEDPNSLSHNTVRALYEDRQGTLWIGCGFAWDVGDDGGLNRFNPETQSFTRFLHDPQDPQSLVHNRVRAIFEDSRGTFWVGSLGDGLHTMNRSTGKFTRHAYDPQNPTALSRSPLNNSADHITFITEDSEGQIWIGTEDNGLIRYDYDSQQTIHYGLGANEESGFTDRSGWAIQSLPNGLLYFSTQFAQLFKIDLKNLVIPHYQDDIPIMAFLQPSASELWLGTIFSGIHIQDLTTGEIKRIYNQSNSPGSLSSNNINHLFQDRQDNIWASTNVGLSKFVPRLEKFEQYLNDPDDSSTIRGSDFMDILEDMDGNIWVGSLGGGLNKYIPHLNQFMHYESIPSDPTTLSGDQPTELLIEDEDHILIGLRGNDGVNRMNVKTGAVHRMLPGLNIFDIYRDSRGIIWLGSANGLYLKNEQGSFELFKNEVLVNGISTAVRSILEDDLHNLWLGTGIGLMRMDKELKQVILYNQSNGLQGDNQGHLEISFKRNDGRLYFNGNWGYYAFHPGEFERMEDQSKIIIMELWFGDQLINPGDHPRLKEPISQITEINLAHHENTFGLGFSKIDFRDNGESNIQYMLENYDPAWRDAFEGERLSYFRVPPGNYNFKIRSLNTTNGNWVEENLMISIAPPWWRTIWAYVLYAILIASAVAMIDRYQRKRLVAKERAKAREKELAQAKEIEKAYKQLQATQSQLIHTEKMASLGELTAGIAHEIQNPLNFVNNFSEVSGEMIDEAVEEMKGGDYNEAQDILINLKNNLSKITHHGHRASGIVKNMLAHSKAGTGDREPTDLNQLADEYLRLAYHGLRAKDNTFRTTFETILDKELPQVTVAKQDIGRVLLNLINNAFYACDQKSKQSDNGYIPKVTVKTEHVNGLIQVIIQDNGTGIPQEMVDKIFQPFFTTKPTGQGTGLGLSLAYDIVTKGHGGNLKVKSKESEGTEFIIELPITEDS